MHPLQNMYYVFPNLSFSYLHEINIAGVIQKLFPFYATATPLQHFALVAAQTLCLL